MKKTTIKIARSGGAIYLATLIAMIGCRPQSELDKPLKDILMELKPGMTISQVKSAIPSVYLVDQESTTNTLWLTTLLPKDATVATHITYGRNPPDWRPLGSVENGDLYFDSSNRLVGLRYSSSRYSFDPSQLSQWRDTNGTK